ncbi:MAG TPA: hypothetical protein VFL29_05750 [Candidatus Dormibacteraeota bacterium]|nr:hypothetical protein [Candidatus Dormibacteraeota bacterium]
MLDVARGRRQRGAIVAAVAAILTVVAVALYERATKGEGVEIGDVAAYPIGAAGLLGLVGAWLAFRSAGDVRRHGVDAPILMLALAVVLGVLGAAGAFLTPAIYNAGHEACLAGGSKAMLGTTAVPSGCGSVIPDGDFPAFYSGALAAALAVVAALVAIVLLVRAHVPREQPG